MSSEGRNFPRKAGQQRLFQNHILHASTKIGDYAVRRNAGRDGSIGGLGSFFMTRQNERQLVLGL
jgi:hypothetical protein